MKTGELFLGSRQGCLDYLRPIDGHYVYILRRPDGRAFYVGKGVGDRVFYHENEARHPNDRRSNAYKLNVIRSIREADAEMIYEIDFVGDAASALAREAQLIGALKRLHEGGPLTNLDPGGGSIAGPSPISVEKHSATLAGAPEDNPERATLNGFVLSIARMDSVVVKPVSQFRARPTQKYPNKTMGPSLRQAVALVASAAANGIRMDRGCRIPRRLEVQGVAGLIENGVACDILTSGMGDLIAAPQPSDEVFSLTERQSRQAIGLVGLLKCRDLGVTA